MLTQTAKYALRAVALLAAAPGEWHEVRRVAGAVGVPANYLSKILGQLGKVGVLESRKGPGGGFRLGRDPATVSLETIVVPLDGAARAESCVFGLEECSDDKPCPLHDQWKRIQHVYHEMLRERTLAELIEHTATEGRTGGAS